MPYQGTGDLCYFFPLVLREFPPSSMEACHKWEEWDGRKSVSQYPLEIEAYREDGGL